MNNKSDKSAAAANRGEHFQALEPRQMYAADLSITALTVDTPVTSSGQSFTITYTVKNNGDTATTKTIFVRNFLSRDDTFGNADDIGLDTGFYKPSIPPGGSVTFDVKSGTGISQPSGSFRIAGLVDSVKLIAESNEDNNVALTKPAALTIAEFLDHDSLPGTAGDDRIDLSIVSGRAIMVVNGQAFSRPVGFFTDALFINCGAGNDKVSTTPDFSVPLAITGAGGNDTIVGGKQDDELSGANGKDKILGGAGFDYLLGGAGADKLFGEAGRDTLSGAGGNDTLDAGQGTDKLLGGNGNDRLIALDDNDNDFRDSISGNAGIDTALSDTDDVLAGIEK